MSRYRLYFMSMGLDIPVYPVLTSKGAHLVYEVMSEKDLPPLRTEVVTIRDTHTNLSLDPDGFKWLAVRFFRGVSKTKLEDPNALFIEVMPVSKTDQEEANSLNLLQRTFNPSHLRKSLGREYRKFLDREPVGSLKLLKEPQPGYYESLPVDTVVTLTRRVGSGRFYVSFLRPIFEVPWVLGDVVTLRDETGALSTLSASGELTSEFTILAWALSPFEELQREVEGCIIITKEPEIDLEEELRWPD